MSAPSAVAIHPLDPLTADEIATAASIFRRERDADAMFAVLTRHEPSHAEWREYVEASGHGAAADGNPTIDRRAWVVAIVGPDTLAEAVVNLTRDGLDSYREVEGERPYLVITEILNALGAVRAHAGWIDAMATRGISGDDLDKIQMDPWPHGTFGTSHEAGRRLTKVLFYWRDDPEANGYAHPIEGLMVVVDLSTAEVLEVVDAGVVPIPRTLQSYYPEDVGPARTDLKPIEITQPEGPSWHVDGHAVEWQRWKLRVSMDQIEGLVLHDISFHGRPILHRAAISEMVVPYGHTAESQRWKNAFDAGEWGLGRMANSLTLGCDCLGEIHYFDAVLAGEHGEANTLTNAICLHEEDYSILWKHTDPHSFRSEVRRQRRLVVSAIHTVGNYEYGFYWYFYLDGAIQLEVKLTGIIQPMGVDPEQPTLGNANLVAPGIAAPHHQHLFCVRLDMNVDGSENSVVEVDVVPDEAGPDNPEHNGFHTEPTVLRTELDAQRLIDPGRSRTWHIVNPNVTNALGQPVAYKLVPTSTPTLLAGAASRVHQRATFATKNLWVTAYDPDEIHAAGRYPNQSGGGGGLPAWTSANRPIENTDIVVWHAFGVTHIVRPEDWPVMPVESTGFWLVPFGFFDRNPTLDVPAAREHCEDH